MNDLISRQAAIDVVKEIRKKIWEVDIPSPTVPEYIEHHQQMLHLMNECDKNLKLLYELPSAQPKWIPVSERLPEDTYPVNITWVNHKPEPYYESIKDKPFTATGCYCDGKWYWYSVTCQDYLDEYRYSTVDAMDEEIEVTAWMPLPEPWRGESE